eukprot:TRINITY_DN8898_c0_g1_i2.p2 TRINITY_DN8898_c0_g1~~TRINITY_DN8898_c0_g1_i2.p2  ORF type:complete len:111 (+),score=21.59 TRINITY_DN8898_c0_g1_i2:464-796(+)
MAYIIKELRLCLESIKESRTLIEYSASINASFAQHLENHNCNELANDTLNTSKIETLLMQRINNLLDGETPYKTNGYEWETFLDGLNDKYIHNDEQIDVMDQEVTPNGDS